MEGVKMTINVRKMVIKEQSKLKIHIKTQKQLARNQNDKNFQREKKWKMRHTSMLSHTPSKKLLKLQTKKTSPISKKQRIGHELPEIYHPASTKNKNSSTKCIGVISQIPIKQKKAFQSQHGTQTSENSRSHIRRIPQKIKLTEIQQGKQMSRQKKSEMFKNIRSQFYQLINNTNKIYIRNNQQVFKAYIEKGNNSVLIKESIKRRWWWHIVDDSQKANLVWTEWYHKKTVNDLPLSQKSDQTIAIEEYQAKQLQGYDPKSKAVMKIVDDKKFKELQHRISQSTHSYFKHSSIREPCFSLSQKKVEQQDEQFKIFEIEDTQKIHNHVQGCLNLHSKKLLFRNFQHFMSSKNRDPFEFLPLTFYIDKKNSENVNQLLKKFDQIAQSKNENQKNIWICKPGENSNRGNGIKVINTREDILKEIQSRLGDNKGHRTIIIQKYIEKCFLIKNRKFDIRCYILLTTVNGILKGYWYRDGYIRTASIQYDLNNIDDPMIHLTNDAVQKKGEQFGKYEDNNKMSFEGFKQYIKKNGTNPFKFDTAYEQMKMISYYLIASVSSKIKRRQFTFELFGLDFMLDEDLKPYLIQANSNPCLQSRGKILGKLIYELIENVMMTAIDPVFPPPSKRKNFQYVMKDHFESNKFELIFAGNDSSAKKVTEKNQ